MAIIPKQVIALVIPVGMEKIVLKKLMLVQVMVRGMITLIMVVMAIVLARVDMPAQIAQNH